MVFAPLGPLVSLLGREVRLKPDPTRALMVRLKPDPTRALTVRLKPDATVAC
jgi:hypothetical protein